MLSLVFDLGMSLRIDNSLVANASIGANGHVIQCVARALCRLFSGLPLDLYRQHQRLRINPEILLPSILALAF
tara:strand:- start:690 stop:908 length:219 start_codon:yes stop_codon:yes gene_type:complete